MLVWNQDQMKPMHYTSISLRSSTRQFFKSLNASPQRLQYSVRPINSCKGSVTFIGHLAAISSIPCTVTAPETPHSRKNCSSCRLIEVIITSSSSQLPGGSKYRAVSQRILSSFLRYDNSDMISGEYSSKGFGTAAMSESYKVRIKTTKL